MKKIIATALLTLLPLIGVRDANASSVSLEEMVGQMLMVGFRGTGTLPHSTDFTVLLNDIEQGIVGNVILFERDAVTKEYTRNIESAEQVKKMIALFQAKAKIPLFIGVDQEGGRVRRFKEKHGAPMTPSAQKLGRLSEKNTYAVSLELGKFLWSVGINVNFAPSVDLAVNPTSPAIGALERSYSDNAKTVTTHALAFAKGMHDAGLISSFKHFPGHGSSTDDTHDGVTDITDTWTEKELEPYKNSKMDKNKSMVMVGHMMLRSLDPELPSSLSSKIVTGVLRQQLGWEGVVITDDLNMKAISDHYSLEDVMYHVINAGVDIILLGNNLQYDAYAGRKAHAAIMKLISENKISKERIQESYDRIIALKKINLNKQ